MKKLIEKHNKISAILSLLIVSLIILGCSGAEKPAMPAEAETQTLVKNTISDFADAIDKEDFKGFMEKSSKELQTQYTAEQMKSTFNQFIQKKDVIVPLLREASKKDAQFSPAPALREEKGYSILVANGSIDGKPVPVKFQNEYIYQDGKWKLLKIQINL